TDGPAASPRISRRRFLTRSGGVMLVAGSLPAILDSCTQAESSTNPTPSGGGGSTTGTLKVGWSSEPDTMNPLTSYSTEAAEVLQLVYDKLSDYDAQLGVIPGLAESTTVASDGTITYHLR